MAEDQFTSELSERLSELFVLSAALYFAELGQTGDTAAPKSKMLHDIAWDLAVINTSPGSQEEARTKLLRDGLEDAAELAETAGSQEIATTLHNRAQALSVVFEQIETNPWN